MSSRVKYHDRLLQTQNWRLSIQTWDNNIIGQSDFRWMITMNGMCVQILSESQTRTLFVWDVLNVFPWESGGPVVWPWCRAYACNVPPSRTCELGFVVKLSRENIMESILFVIRCQNQVKCTPARTIFVRFLIPNMSWLLCCGCKILKCWLIDV